MNERILTARFCCWANTLSGGFLGSTVGIFGLPHLVWKEGGRVALRCALLLQRRLAAAIGPVPSGALWEVHLPLEFRREDRRQTGV